MPVNVGFYAGGGRRTRAKCASKCGSTTYPIEWAFDNTPIQGAETMADLIKVRAHLARCVTGCARELCCVLVMLVAVPCQAADRHYLGVAYADGGDRVSYREEHWVYEDKDGQTRLVLYRCPSGAPFARKWVRERGRPVMPDFDFVDARNGYREGAHRQADGLEVYVQKGADAPRRATTLALPEDGVIDAGFDAYVRNHWARLGQRSDLHMAFMVPSRLSYMDLRLDVTQDGSLDGQPVRRLRMSLAGLLGLVTPTIELTYAMGDHRLLRFQGISNIRDDAGRNQRVRIEFSPSDERSPPTRAEIDAAGSMALVAHCPA